jgi:mRNA interferase MazF
MTPAAAARGVVVAIADRGGDFTGKPRPAVIIQSDVFNKLESVTICPLTSTMVEASVLRLPVKPSQTLNLRTPSWIAVDKITSVRRDRIGQSMGKLSAEDMQLLNGAIAVFLGLGG